MSSLTSSNRSPTGSTLAGLLRESQQHSRERMLHQNQQNHQNHQQQRLAALCNRDNTPDRSSGIEEDLSCASDSSKCTDVSSDQPYDLSVRRKETAPTKISFGKDSPLLEYWPPDSVSTQNGESSSASAAAAAASAAINERLTASDSKKEATESEALTEDADPIGSMLRGMDHLRKNRLLCDVVLRLRDKEFHAHRAVLAACSGFCRDRVLGANFELQLSPVVIELDDDEALSSRGVEAMLDFVYTGRLEVGLEGLAETLRVARHLKVPKLIRACEEQRLSAAATSERERVQSWRAGNRRSQLDALGAGQRSSELTSASLTLGRRPLQDGRTEVKRECRSFDLSTMPETSEGEKQRRASDSYAALLEDRTRREMHRKENGSLRISHDEMVRILQHSKSDQGLLVGVDNRGNADACSSQAARQGKAGDDVYQPIHWKKHQFIGRRAEKMQQDEPALHRHADAVRGNQQPFFAGPASDEVFKPDDSSRTSEFARNLTSNLAGSANGMKSFFPYNFQTKAREGFLEKGSPMFPYCDLTPSQLLPSLFAFPFGANRSPAIDHSIAYLRSRTQGYDFNQAHLRPSLLAPTCGPMISSLFNHNHITTTSFPFSHAERQASVASQSSDGVGSAQRRKTTSSENSATEMMFESKRLRSESSSAASLSPTNIVGNTSNKNSASAAHNEGYRANERASLESKTHNLKPFLRKAPDVGKPYKCLLCDANFNRPANLKTHMRIHSGEKPYKCDTCGARFVQVAHLRAHVLIHTGEKPYPCTVCGTRFRHLQTLKSHLRIHTGEKPYSCEQCSVQFRHKSQLRLHLRTKHGIQTNTKKTYKQVPGLSSADICAHIKRAQEAAKIQGPSRLMVNNSTRDEEIPPATDRHSSGVESTEMATPDDGNWRSEDGCSTTEFPLGGNSGLFKINMRARLETIKESMCDPPAAAGGPPVGIKLHVT